MLLHVYGQRNIHEFKVYLVKFPSVFFIRLKQVCNYVPYTVYYNYLLVELAIIILIYLNNLLLHKKNKTCENHF